MSASTSQIDLAGVPPEEQLAEALARVKAHGFHLKRALDGDRLMDAVKHAVDMCGELRVASLAPKQYYELYMAAFARLRDLSVALMDAHRGKLMDLAELYERVQYAAAIVPRLYLMITVGAAYLPMGEAPVTAILRDLADMCRGVQHPVRGLFLRHYLSSMTKDYLPDVQDTGVGAGVADSIAFVMHNFVEMNKLWVRLQHQGSTKERERREEERRELRILVGTNIVRLSQLDAVTLPMYQAKILPPILDQIVNCRDVIAQEYLMEVIIQVFPDTFHLRTLQPLLAVAAKLQPQVNIKQIIVALIDRLRTYASSTLSSKESAASTTAEKSESREEEEKEHESNHEESGEEEDEDGIPDNVQLFDVFWLQIARLIEARPDLGIADISSLLVSLLHLSVACYPQQLEYVDQILHFAKDQSTRVAGTPELSAATTTSNFHALLMAPLQGAPAPNGVTVGARDVLDLFALKDNAAAFRELLALQPYTTRHAVATHMATSLVAQQPYISTEAHFQGLVECLSVLIKDQKDAPAWKNMGMVVDREAATAPDRLNELALEQAPVAKLAALIYNPDHEKHMALLSAARKAFAEGGGARIRFTFPTLVYQAVRLVERMHAPITNDTTNGASSPKDENAGPSFSNTQSPGGKSEEATRALMPVFKYIHQVITALQVKSDDVEQALQLFLTAARAADMVGLEEIAYEFFVSALTVYEECINDSRTQFLTLTSIVNALVECRVFSVDNYDTIATKCTLHASRLLKRPDQCRAVVQCSHLFWPQNTQYRDAKRVLECLQKALKFADTCLDPVANAELFIETLVRYIYYYERGCAVVTGKAISGLLDLIATNLGNLHDANDDSLPHTGKGAFSASAASLVGLGVGNVPMPEGAGARLRAVTQHFARTCQMLLTRKQMPPRSAGDASPNYADIVVPSLPFL